MSVVWGQRLGRPECPFGRRWVIDLGFVAFRLHRWYTLGYQEVTHDHAWPFVTFILRGGYTDVTRTADGSERREQLRVGSVRYRSAEHCHYVHVDKSGGLSLVVSGPAVRAVRFYGRGRSWTADEWMSIAGPQPCDGE